MTHTQRDSPGNSTRHGKYYEEGHICWNGFRWVFVQSLTVWDLQTTDN